MRNTDYGGPHFIIVYSRLLLPFSIAIWPDAMKYTAQGLQQYGRVYTSKLLCEKIQSLNIICVYITGLFKAGIQFFDSLLHPYISRFCLLRFN
jgi:hypothetical protein